MLSIKVQFFVRNGNLEKGVSKFRTFQDTLGAGPPLLKGLYNILLRLVIRSMHIGS